MTNNVNKNNTIKEDTDKLQYTDNNPTQVDSLYKFKDTLWVEVVAD